MTVPAGTEDAAEHIEPMPLSLGVPNAGTKQQSGKSPPHHHYVYMCMHMHTPACTHNIHCNARVFASSLFF